MSIRNVVLLVGGVGGAKLAYGLSQIMPVDQLTIIVNTGDDFWHYGLRICPDLDTITYTLGNRVDKRQGWGVANDTTQMLGALELYGEEPWFRLGDMDLATHLLRTNLLRDGETLTTITARLSSALGISHRILPMTDDEVATIVHTVEHGPLAFQTYFVRHRWQPVLESLSYDGAERAKASADVLTAINEADAIIVGPSNPWLSIAPILALDELRTALLAHDVPRVAVSPIVGGEAIKGPTAKIMQELEIEPAATSVADYYGSVINGFMYDQTDGALAIDGLRTTAQQTVMRTDRDKIALAEALMAWIEDWE